MSDQKRPYFKFFPRDWLSDEKVRALSFFARGVYIEILALLWKSSTCSLPDDIDRLSRIVGLPRNEFEKAWNEIQFPGQKMLVQMRGKIYSKRLKNEMTNLLDVSRKRSDAARYRWEREFNANASVLHMQNNAITDTDTDTDTEKEKKKEKKRKAARPPKVSTIPSNFKITDPMRVWFEQQNFKYCEIESATAEFVDYWASEGKTKKDWVATWRNGMRKTEKWLKRDNGDDESWRISR
jgi:hypothetical protein